MLHRFAPFGALIAIVAMSAPARAQPSTEWARKTVPIEVFGQFPSIDRPALSPNGDLIAAKARADGRQALAILPIGQPDAKPFIVAGDSDFSKGNFGDREIYRWQWIDNQNLLIWIRGLDFEFGQWIDVTRIAAYNIKSRKATPLGWDGAAGWAGDVLWMSPPDTPKPHLLLQRFTNRNSSEMWAHPEVIDIDVETGAVRNVQRSNPVVSSWTADRSGVVRMGWARDRENGKLRVLYRTGASETFRTILHETPDQYDDTELPDYILSGSNKAYALSNRDGFRALYEYDLDKMALGQKVFGVAGYDISDATITPDGTALQSVTYSDQRTHRVFYEPRLKEIAKLLDQEFGAGNVNLLSADQKREKILFSFGALGQVPAYYLLNTVTGDISLISWSNETLKNAKLNPVQTFRYTASDGKSIEAILTLPRHRTGEKNLPLIVMPHGGPWARDDADWDSYQWAQTLAEYGYVVVQPNYRGSTGYGKEFGKAVNGNWGLRMQDDLNDVIPWLAKDGTIDPKRVCMVGWSYGGYAASRAAQRDGDKYRCAVSGAGVHDLPAMVNYDKNYLGGYGAKMGLGAAGDLGAISPAYHPEMFSTPILIVHGAKDQRVPVAQSRGLVSKLKGAGKKEGVDFLYLEQPLNTHNLLREQDRTQFLQEMKKFLDKHNPA
ncbi:dipeptidyl aminopeptidase/acylaminoacyl peptidase [Sphingomonas leidyi]|uniref:Dipeptidyl aminopeptidase/acylaminoacyl peptidase n=1 Tax=Sphingomonas leidyi TaxID=68569 RepID=A0A7X5V3I0_9SPHN|nr:alpha/beta fold hydrolase [Sphingomonas leidyi]NIJ67088.1 dipeptidyl aminopeptidase/acylaminoacyl peptidase [Sphingomonas leidyi]